MDAVQHELLERYAAIYRDVLALCTKVPRRELKGVASLPLERLRSSPEMLLERRSDDVRLSSLDGGRVDRLYLS
jgi:hypothetical protein